MAHYNYPGDIGQYIDSLTLIVEQQEPMENIKAMVKRSDAEVNLPVTELGSATLPIPNAINEQMIHNWNITSGLTEEGMGAIEGLGGNMFNSGKKFLARTGVHIEPHYLQTYEGTMPRNFDCEWVFIPQNEGEANTIASMIKSFKAWASPSPGKSELFVKQPAFWTLVFTPRLQDMIRFKKMVCTNIGVNYAPGGYSDFFHDGFPKQINLSMSFAERSVTYRDDWK